MKSVQVRPEEEATVVHRWLVGLVLAVCRHPRMVLATALTLAVLSTWAFCTRLTYQTHRNDLVSPNKDHQQRWRSYLAEFGNDDDMVVVVQGSDRRAMKDALEQLAARVRGQPEQFDRLFYKVDLHNLHNRALLYLPTEQIAGIRRNLGHMSPLLEMGPIAWHLFTLQALVQEATNRVHQLGPGGKVSAGDEQFLSQLSAISRSAAAFLADPSDYRSPWHAMTAPPGHKPEAQAPGHQQQDLMTEPQYFFSGNGTGEVELAFLLVRPVQETGSFTAARKSVETLRSLVNEVRPGFPRLQMGVTGLPVLENDEMVAAQGDTLLASWLALAGVTVLFFVVYRGVAYPLLTIGTLLIGTSWAMGWMTLTVGHVNILSATFAVMLIGMGDYGVLWVMRYEQARRLGADVRTALRHTTCHVAVGNLTAASTLALAFFAAMLADFKAVAELGWIAGCGVLFCALACFTVLPALLVLFDRRGVPVTGSGRSGKPSYTLPLPTGGGHQPTASWLPGLTRRPAWVLAVGAGLLVVLGVFACRVGYDHNLLHLQASDLDAVKWEMTLIRHTAGASWHALSYTDSADEALALKARYEKLPEVSRVVEVASLVPANQAEKIDILRDIHAKLGRLPSRGQPITHLRPNSEALRAQVAGLIQVLQGNGGPVAGASGLSNEGPVAGASDLSERNKPEAPATGPAHEPRPLFSDLRDGLRELNDQLAKPSNRTVTETRLQAFEQRLVGGLAEDLHRLRDVSAPEPIRLEDLPADFRERYVGHSGKWLLRVFARDCLWDFEPLEHFTQQILTVDPRATGKPFSTVEGLKAMKNGFQWAGLYALLVITLVLLSDFRSPARTLLALLPLAMGVVLSLGILGLFGLPLNPANMIAFPLILGVGVDNGVHVLHDFLMRRREGKSTISYAIGRGVLVKALTTMIGFGTLMISSERGLMGLGFILTLGVGCCMLSALVFLPALLGLVAGTTRAAATAKEEVRRLAA
jgi:predicted RND superfamily exporter protein